MGNAVMKLFKPVTVGCLMFLCCAAEGKLTLDIGQSKQVFTILPQRPGLNMAELMFVDLDHDGKDDLFVAGDASYGGDNRASFFLILSKNILPENSPFDLSLRP